MNNKDTIVFCADHFGALAQCIALTCAFRKTHRIFLLTSAEESQIPCLTRLSSLGFFDVAFYDYRFASNITDADTLLTEIDRYFCRIFDENGIDIGHAYGIFLSNSGFYSSLGIFLSNRQLEYSLVEFSKNDIYRKREFNAAQIHKGLSEAYLSLLDLHGALNGQGAYCREIIYNNGSIPYSDTDNARFIDLASMLRSIKRDDRLLILSAYQNVLPMLTDKALILPNSQSLSKRGLAGKEGYIKRIEAGYTLLADLVCGGDDVIIKPHPHGALDFERYFKGSIILDKTFPIEFLNLIDDFKITELVSVETSATDKIEGICLKNTSVGRDFFLSIEYMIRLWVTVKLSCLLGREIALICNKAQGPERTAKVLAEALGAFPIKLTDRLELDTGKLFASFDAIDGGACIGISVSESELLYPHTEKIYLYGAPLSALASVDKTEIPLKVSGVSIILNLL